MSEVSFTWELGQNYGHITRFMPLVQRLRKLGHNSQLILRDLSRLHHVIQDEIPPVFQAPVWIPRLIDPPKSQSYADIMFGQGYGDVQGLRALIGAWIGLFELNRTALVVADYSPTAMLAARIMQLPCAMLGTGFYSPPGLSPIPPLCWWLDADNKRLAASEETLVANINEVLNIFNATPLARLSDLFEVDETFLCTFAELDHYPQRSSLSPKPNYLGPDMLLDMGELPCWPDVQGPKVFAYLNASWAGFEDMLKTFKSLPISVLAHVPALTPAQQQAYSARNIHVTSELLQMRAVREQCEFAVCHGGLATVSAMLAAGRPLLLAPTHTEQTIVSKNVEKLSAGLTLRSDTKRYPPKKLLTYLLEEPGFRKQAAAFAERYKDYSHEKTRDDIAARCHEIIIETEQKR